VRERYQIFLRKRAGKPRPWSDDEIFQTCYFTNVHRQCDKTTIWLNQNIREPFREDPRVLFAILTFRWFNWPPTGEALLGASVRIKRPWLKDQGNLLLEWSTDEAVYRLEELKRQGQKIVTGAFNVSNAGSTKPKINRICEDYIQPVWDDRERFLSFFTDPKHWNGKVLTLEEVFRFLSAYPGLRGSGFMAGQVIADIKYTKFLENAPDKKTWCVIGPGARRGLNRILGRPVDAPIPKDWKAHMEELSKLVNDRNKVGPIPFIDMADLQSIGCCEFDKYERVLWGEGRSKRTYDGIG
jgi:hypothetical protein